ncbi:hypothetical protein BGW42_005066 [Actinomortierella wolfii]|nr:hypothetical protein BGW42_005066 [Actinomortierella wolfii]
MGMQERSCFQRHRWKIIPLAILLVVAAVVIPLVVVKPWDKNQASDNNNNKEGDVQKIPPNQPIVPSTDDSVKANAYTPALNEPFDYRGGSHKIRGINLGGWLVLEPFITPSLFDPYISQGVVDEYTLCKHLGPKAAYELLDKHYASWVTEETFVRIRKLGLNHVRIPIGFWARGNLTADEPYVADLSWKYLLRGIEWARKNGLRVLVELHAAPGSQNGWNHSGRVGSINWIKGPQGPANAKRTITYINDIVAQFNKPEYQHVAPIFGLLNEPAGYVIGADEVKAWSEEAFSSFRSATGNGKGPWGVLHDGFIGQQAWLGTMRSADRVMMDYHNYIMFDLGLQRMPREEQLRFACSTWGPDMTSSQRNFGPSIVGEFSVAVNDCARFLNGIGNGARYDGTFDGQPAVSPNSTCTNENNAATYSAEYKTFLRNYFLAQIEAAEQGSGWFYWNFKTESNPLWSYFDGVDGGWIPADANQRGEPFCRSRGYPLTTKYEPPAATSTTSAAVGQPATTTAAVITTTTAAATVTVTTTTPAPQAT